MKNKYSRKPAFCVSASEEDMILIREIRDKYHVIIAPYIRQQLLKLHKELKKNEKSQII